jgi:hypothetical protein
MVRVIILTFTPNIGLIESLACARSVFHFVDRNPLQPESSKLDSWKEWVSSTSTAVTSQHHEHLCVTVSLQAARAVLRRRQLHGPADYEAATKILRCVVAASPSLYTHAHIVHSRYCTSPPGGLLSCVT